MTENELRSKLRRAGFQVYQNGEWLEVLTSPREMFDALARDNSADELRAIRAAVIVQFAGDHGEWMLLRVAS
jgi:hypothetical protein